MAWYVWIISIVVILILVKLYIILTTRKCVSHKRLDGKTVIITGCNTGIGKEAALDLAKRGARVIMACRNLKAANEACAEIIAKSKNPEVIVHKLDLQSLESVRNFSKTIHETESQLDILINNAGCHGLGRKYTDDGLYVGMQVNHFGPYLLTNLLIDMLISSAPSRIVNTASLAYIFSLFDGKNLNKPSIFDMINYCNTKLCNIWMTRELARRLQNVGITCNCLHPGSVRTELFRKITLPLKIAIHLWGYLFFKSPEEGAQTIIHLAVSDEVSQITGKYFMECSPAMLTPRARNNEMALNVWKASSEFVKLKPEERHPALWNSHEK